MTGYWILPFENNGVCPGTKFGTFRDCEVQYISLYKDDEEKVQCETATEFELLEHNAIMDTFRQLYRFI